MEQRQPVTLVDPLRQSPRINLSESPSLGLDHGGCALPEQLDNHLGLPHVVLGEPETIHLVSMILPINRKG